MVIQSVHLDFHIIADFINQVYFQATGIYQPGYSADIYYKAESVWRVPM